MTNRSVVRIAKSCCPLVNNCKCLGWQTYLKYLNCLLHDIVSGINIHINILSGSYRIDGGSDRITNSAGLSDGAPLCFWWNAGNPSMHRSKPILVILFSMVLPINSSHQTQSYTSVIRSGSTPSVRLFYCLKTLQNCCNESSASKRSRRGNQTTNSCGLPLLSKRSVPHFAQTFPGSPSRHTWSHLCPTQPCR